MTWVIDEYRYGRHRVTYHGIRHGALPYHLAGRIPDRKTARALLAKIKEILPMDFEAEYANIGELQAALEPYQHLLTPYIIAAQRGELALHTHNYLNSL